MIMAGLGRIGGAGLSIMTTDSTGGPTDGVAAFCRGGVGDRAGVDDLQIGGPVRLGGRQTSIEKHGLDIAGLGVVDAAAENRDSKGPFLHGKMVSSPDLGVSQSIGGRFSSGPGGNLTSDLHLSCL